jgi:hypothetical protein
MDLEKIEKRAWLSWAGITLLLILCAILAALQYRWIGEVAHAEHQRLREDLESRLNLLRRSLNDDVSNACYAYVPSRSEIERLGRGQAYLRRYGNRKHTAEQVVRQIALAVPENEDVTLLVPDASGTHFSHTVWPASWSAMHERLLAGKKNLDKTGSRANKNGWCSN